MAEKEPKLFERVQLVTIFNERSLVGSFVSRRPAPMPEHPKQGQLLPLPPVDTVHDVFALTVARFSDDYRIAVVEQQIIVTMLYPSPLAEDHFYRQKDLPRVTIERGVSSEAEIVRRVVAMADSWKGEIEKHLPPGLIDLTGATERAERLILESVRDGLAEQGIDATVRLA